MSEEIAFHMGAKISDVQQLSTKKYSASEIESNKNQVKIGDTNLTDIMQETVKKH